MQMPLIAFLCSWTFNAEQWEQYLAWALLSFFVSTSSWSAQLPCSLVLPHRKESSALKKTCLPVAETQDCQSPFACYALFHLSWVLKIHGLYALDKWWQVPYTQKPRCLACQLFGLHVFFWSIRERNWISHFFLIACYVPKGWYSPLGMYWKGS